MVFYQSQGSGKQSKLALGISFALSGSTRVAKIAQVAHYLFSDHYHFTSSDTFKLAGTAAETALCSYTAGCGSCNQILYTILFQIKNVQAQIRA